MARELGERIAVHVRREVGAHHVAGLLAHVLRAPLGVDAGHLVGQYLDFFPGEERGEEEIAVALELRDLRLGQFHDPYFRAFSSTWKNTSSCRIRPSS